MAYEAVAHPIPGWAAFSYNTDAAVQSQAALLLMLGRQLRGDDRALRACAAAARSLKLMEVMPADEAAEFPVPRLRPAGKRMNPEAMQAQLIKRYGSRAFKAKPGEAEPGLFSEALVDLAVRLYRKPTQQAAAELLEASLRHPDELVRVAAAAAYFELSAEPRRLLWILERGTHSADSLVREVAATALARAAPEHHRLRELRKPGPAATGGAASQTGLLVHGTFARNESWWQTGGDFHDYLDVNVRFDLYSATDRFEWSGGYSDAARLLGSSDLRAWVGAHNLDSLDLFAHSHGGSVAMLASQAGLNVGTLVLLSCPVHIHKYVPDFNRISRTISIRVHLDLVILADRGGQRFRHSQIEEHVLPIWFNHSATHDPRIWQEHDVPTLI